MSGPQKCESPAATGQTQDQSTNKQIIGAVDPARKAFASLQARAALAGIALHRINRQDGAEAFLVSRWALSREFDSLEAVEDWLERVGGRHGF